jgi:hypothetical protein
VDDVARAEAARVLEELAAACRDGRLEASAVLIGGLVGARAVLSDPDSVH